MELKHRVRALWRNNSAAEQKLWRVLQNPHQHPQLYDHHFRRHVALGDFFVDFMCTDLKLVIELDGGQRSPEKSRDLQQTTVLQYRGFLVVRLWQKEILDNLQGVLDGLNIVLCQRKLSLSRK
jgi:very-short-patch-repair endonuclease